MFYLIQAYVHDNSEFPTDIQFFSFIQPGQEVSMRISPTLTETENEIRSYHIQARQCLFHDEVIIANLLS